MDQNTASRLGMLADDHVRSQRLMLFPHHLVISDGYFYDEQGRAESLRREWCSLQGLDPYLALIRLALQSDKRGRNYLQASAPGAALKPDLVDFQTREVWEVKPTSRYGTASAPSQLELYVNLLNVGEGEYTALSRHERYRSHHPQAPAGKPRPWRPGSAWSLDDYVGEVDGRSVRLGFTHPQPGVIQWRLV